METGTSTMNQIGGAVGTAASLYNLGSAIFGNKNNDQKQIDQQGKLIDQQKAANEQIATYNQGLSKDMWDYTNYENQVAHIKNAGLNPAMLYGGGGGGGATTNGGNAQGVASGTAPSTTDRENAATNKQNAIANSASNMYNVQMQEAQIEAIKSQSEKNNADAELSKTQAAKLGGPDTENVGADTAVKKAQIPKIGEETKGITLKNSYQAIQNAIQENTQNSQENTIKSNAENAENQVQLQNQQIDANLPAKQAANTVADTLMKKANTDLTHEQIGNIKQQIQQRWTEIGNETTNIKQQHDDRLKMMTTILEAAGIQAASKMASDILDAYMGKPSTTPAGSTTIRTDKDGNQSYEQKNYQK